MSERNRRKNQERKDARRESAEIERMRTLLGRCRDYVKSALHDHRRWQHRDMLIESNAIEVALLETLNSVLDS